MIIASYYHHADLGCEVVLFLDDQSGECLQIQRDLNDPAGTDQDRRYCVTTGVGAPEYGGIQEWRRTADEFEFALTPRAARMFGGSELLTFRVTPGEGQTLDMIADHLARLIG